MITVSTEIQAKIDAGVPPIELVKFSFAGVPDIYLTTANFDIEFSGETWQANGFVLDTEPQQRESEVRTSSGTITLTAVDLTTASIMLNNNQVNRRIDIYNAWLNSDGTLVTGTYLRDSYYINDWGINQGTSKATVAIQLSGEWADFEIIKGIKTTDASIKRWYPDDDVFLYSKDITEDLRWGGK